MLVSDLSSLLVPARMDVEQSHSPTGGTTWVSKGKVVNCDSPHQQVTTRENDRVSHRMQTKKTLTGEGMRLLMMMGLII